jgi:ribonuclease HI
MEGRAVVYVDGSGIATGGPAGVGYVALLEESRKKEGSRELNSATSQQAEILAAAHALTELNPLESVLIFSDSEYVVLAMQGRLSKWIARGWRTQGNKPVANQDQWRELLVAKERHGKVEFRWLRGHDGNRWNERADELAYQARGRAESAAVDEVVLHEDPAMMSLLEAWA